MKKAKQVIQEINERAEKPFVTAKFGDNWKEHQKNLILEGQISVDAIIYIAWLQGRRALLLEKAIQDQDNTCEDEHKQTLNAKMFGDYVKEFRTNYKKSVREMGSETGLSAATISRIENGLKPDVDTFLTLQKYMGTPEGLFTN